MRIVPLLLILSAPAAIAFAQTHDPVTNPKDFIRPGYWETVNTLESPIASQSIDRRCVTPADVVKFMQPCNHHYNCEYSTQDIHNGRFALKGEWVGKKDHQVVQIVGVGTYTGDSLKASAEGDTKLLGLKIHLRGTAEAHRLSATCPAESADKH